MSKTTQMEAIQGHSSLVWTLSRPSPPLKTVHIAYNRFNPYKSKIFRKIYMENKTRKSISKYLVIDCKFTLNTFPIQVAASLLKSKLLAI